MRSPGAADKGIPPQPLVRRHEVVVLSLPEDINPEFDWQAERDTATVTGVGALSVCMCAM